MKSKATKKLANLDLSTKQVIKSKNCKKIKGGAYYCCVRNQWYW